MRIGLISSFFASLGMAALISPEAQADECQFFSPDSSGYAARHVVAGYRGTSVFGGLGGYLLVVYPYSRVTYGADTDGDPSTPCYLGARGWAQSPYRLLPSRYGWSLSISAAARSFMGYSPCFWGSFCVKYGASGVVAGGAGEPAVYSTAYVFYTFVY